MKRHLARQRRPSPGWRVGALCAAVGAVTLSVVGGILSAGEPLTMITMGAFGLFFGLLAAPSIQPAAFRRPALVQTLCGAIAGGIATVMLGLGGEGIAFGLLAGGLIGWLAPAWLRYVTMP